MDLLKEENVRLRLVNFIMFPSKALQNSVSARALLDPHIFGSIYLSNAKTSPLFLPQKLQCTFAGVDVIFWYLLDHLFRQLHMSVFKLVIGIAAITGLAFVY